MAREGTIVADRRLCEFCLACLCSCHTVGSFGHRFKPVSSLFLHARSSLGNVAVKPRGKCTVVFLPDAGVEGDVVLVSSCGWQIFEDQLVELIRLGQLLNELARTVAATRVNQPVPVVEELPRDVPVKDQSDLVSDVPYERRGQTVIFHVHVHSKHGLDVTLVV